MEINPNKREENVVSCRRALTEKRKYEGIKALLQGRGRKGMFTSK